MIVVRDREVDRPARQLAGKPLDGRGRDPLPSGGAGSLPSGWAAHVRGGDRHNGDEGAAVPRRSSNIPQLRRAPCIRQRLYHLFGAALRAVHPKRWRAGSIRQRLYHLFGAARRGWWVLVHHGSLELVQV